jgi:hypothetical protein
MANGNAFSFNPQGWLVLESGAGNDCGHSTALCPVYFRNDWPSNVPSDSYTVEAFIQLDTAAATVQTSSIMVCNFFAAVLDYNSCEFQ